MFRPIGRKPANRAPVQHGRSNWWQLKLFYSTVLRFLFASINLRNFCYESLVAV